MSRFGLLPETGSLAGIFMLGVGCVEQARATVRLRSQRNRSQFTACCQHRQPLALTHHLRELDTPYLCVEGLVVCQDAPAVQHTPCAG